MNNFDIDLQIDLLLSSELGKSFLLWVSCTPKKEVCKNISDALERRAEIEKVVNGGKDESN